MKFFSAKCGDSVAYFYVPSWLHQDSHICNKILALCTKGFEVMRNKSLPFNFYPAVGAYEDNSSSGDSSSDKEADDSALVKIK